MDLDLEWEKKVVENLLLDVVQKEEKYSLHKIDLILIMIKIQSLNQNEQFREILKKNKLNNDYFTIYFGKNNYEVDKKKK